jgi:hypothetical protein
MRKVILFFGLLPISGEILKKTAFIKTALALLGDVLMLFVFYFCIANKLNFGYFL